MAVNLKHSHLVEEWRKTYDEFAGSDLSDETDYSNFCWGWCMAKGLTADEGYEFYNSMVDLGVF